MGVPMCGPPTEYVDPHKAQIDELVELLDEQEGEIAALRAELAATKYISHRRWELLQERKRQQSEVEAERDALRAQVERVEAIAELGVREQWPPDEWRAALSSSEPVTAGPEAQCPDGGRCVRSIGVREDPDFVMPDDEGLDVVFDRMPKSVQRFTLAPAGEVTPPAEDEDA